MPTRRAQESESGVTIIEMLAALFLLSVGIAGAASVLAVASRSTVAADTRETADRLIESELERLGALPDTALGIASTASGYQPSFDGRQTVTEPSGNLVLPTETVVSNDQQFDLTRHVTWADATTGSTTVTQAYKVITVVVQWQDAAGDHEIIAETGARVTP